jgi:serine palmitoyltransferase
MEDLEKVLKKVQSDDKRTGRPTNRRFIIVEGLYHNYGDFVPLDIIMKLKEKYCYRVILDDSYGMCTTGKTGRGTCEVFGVAVKNFDKNLDKPLFFKAKDIDILCGNLESTVSSVGGFCCGKPNIIYHQRLNASGYVFSASLPPLLACAAQVALDIVDENPSLISELEAKTRLFVEGMQNFRRKF